MKKPLWVFAVSALLALAAHSQQQPASSAPLATSSAVAGSIAQSLAGSDANSSEAAGLNATAAETRLDGKSWWNYVRVLAATKRLSARWRSRQRMMHSGRNGKQTVFSAVTPPCLLAVIDFAAIKQPCRKTGLFSRPIQIMPSYGAVVDPEVLPLVLDVVQTLLPMPMLERARQTSARP